MNDPDLRLQRAVGHGVLSLADYDTRVRAVWQANTLEELAVPQQGLPDTPASAESSVASRRGVSANRAAQSAAGATALGICALGAALAFGMSLGAADAVAPADPRLRISVGPGQTMVKLGDIVGDLTIFVPPNVRVDASGLHGDGWMDCDLVCAAGAPGTPVTIQGRYTGNVIITR